MHDPGKGRWHIMKWILWYLLKTVYIGLIFKRNDTHNQYAIGYVDSYYANNLDKWRSTADYMFTLVGASTSWKSTLQSKNALSTTEVEYMALAEVVKEAIWLDNYLMN